MTQDGLGCSICASVSQTDGRGIFERIAVIVQEPDIAQNGPHSTGCLDRSFNHLLQIAIFFGILRSANHRNGVIRQHCGISGRKADDSARIFLGHWVMRDLEKLTGFRSGERTDCIVHHSEPCGSTRQKIWVRIRSPGRGAARWGFVGDGTARRAAAAYVISASRRWRQARYSPASYRCAKRTVHCRAWRTTTAGICNRRRRTVSMKRWGAVGPGPKSR